jgi:bisphosphoglycerate-dependent phosphoglycerate mutase
MDRVVACYKECLLPCLTQGESILVVAHGNSIRALLGYLLNYKESELESLNIGWAEPIKIVYDESGLVQSVINYRVKNNPKPSQWPETCRFSQVVDMLAD